MPARKNGLDAADALEVLMHRAACSKAMDQKGERSVKRRFLPPASRLASSCKDTRLILALGTKLDGPPPLVSFAAQAMAPETCESRQERDTAHIISGYGKLANV